MIPACLAMATGLGVTFGMDGWCHISAIMAIDLWEKIKVSVTQVEFGQMSFPPAVVRVSVTEKIS